MRGEYSKELLTIITEDIDRLNDSFGDALEVNKLIPCNCATCIQRTSKGKEVHFYDYEEILDLKDFGEQKIRCRRRPFEYVSIEGLLNTLFVSTGGDINFIESADTSSLLVPIDTQKVKDYIANNMIEECLDYLISSAPEEDAFLLLKSRYSRNAKEAHKGILGRTQYNLEYNKVINAILKLVE